MKLEDFRAYCLAKAAVEESLPLPDDAVFNGDLLKHAASVIRTLKPFDDFLNTAMDA